MGFAKAFGLASLAELHIPISRPMGILWLVAAALVLASAVVLLIAPCWFWLIGAMGLVASQSAIVASWGDARFGTFVNVVLLAAVIYTAVTWGPFGLRAEYQRLVERGLAQARTAAPPFDITEADLVALPPQVRSYLRFAGVVGTPRDVGFRARLTGRIRSSPTAPWMPFRAEQHNFYDPTRRYFWMEATRGGAPVVGLHVYGEADASMRIRLLSLVPVVHLSGHDLMRTETVTVFNDLCLFAPGRLLDPSICWRELDAHRVEATYTNGPHTIRAVLVFEESGALVDFQSDDRPALAEDGRTLLPQRWSTPVSDHQPIGPLRLATRGEGRYAPPSGEYAYIEIQVQDVNLQILVSHGGSK